jgi:hypothetical protein
MYVSSWDACKVCISVVMIYFFEDSAVQQYVLRCSFFFLSMNVSTSIAAGRLWLQCKYLHAIQYLYVCCIRFWEVTLSTRL